MRVVSAIPRFGPDGDTRGYGDLGEPVAAN